MNKYEVTMKHGLISSIWWNFFPGTIITVKWPQKKWITVHTDAAGSIDACTDDPNYHYRSWLEENVGKQGLDWNWKIVASDTTEYISLQIKFRKGKDKRASVAALLWS